MPRIATVTARVPAPGPDPRGWIIREGDAYPDDHPAVKARPELFITPDEWIARRLPEEATARPGEARRVQRRG